jgi:hypothetical protein
VVRFGRTVEDGFLPVFSVDSEKEAKTLIVMACKTNMDGEYIAPELAEEQTLKNLHAFSGRLERMHDILAGNGNCTCKKRKAK